MANFVEEGLNIAYQNLQQLTDFSSDFDYCMVQFIRIYKKYFMRYKNELTKQSIEIVSDNDYWRVLEQSELFVVTLREFTSNTVRHYDSFINYVEKVFKIAEEVDQTIRDADGNLRGIYEALGKYNDFIAVHNSMITEFNSFKSDFKHDIVRTITRYIDEFENFNMERGIYSLRVNLILQTTENLKRRLNHLPGRFNLLLAKPISQSVMNELALDINGLR